VRSVDREEVSFCGGLPLAGLKGGNMRFRFLSVLVCVLLFAALYAGSGFAAVSVFATGTNMPETITQTASGSFFVTDADALGDIWNVPATGGTASSVAQAGFTLRGGLILPGSFGAVGGQFLVTGVGAPDTTGLASTMDASFAVTPYTQEKKAIWTQPVLAPSFGSFSGDVLVTNQGASKKAFTGSVDSITPSGAVGRLATLSSVNTPFGAALAPSGFGTVGGTLLVSDAAGSGIYSVDAAGNVSLFTTIPLGAGQSGLRQIAFAPTGWGRGTGNLFVSVNNADIDVVNSSGSVIGRISGMFSPRGLLFTTLSGSPSLLFSDISTGEILKAGPGDIVPVHG
jgi:hypothetical protein